MQRSIQSIFGTCLCSRFLASGAGGALVDAQKISFREAAALDHRSSFRYHRNGADDRRSPGIVRYGASIQEEEKLRIASLFANKNCHRVRLHIKHRFPNRVVLDEK